MGQLKIALEAVGHSSLLKPKIGISGASIYVIEQLLLLVSQVYGEFPPKQSVTGFVNQF